MTRYKNMKIMFLIIIIVLFNFIKISHTASVKELDCKGIKWSDNKTTYIEWTVKKRIPKFIVTFKINNNLKIAKFSIRKANAGAIIGIGGWERKTGEKSSLTMTYSILNKIFKINSRYTDLRIEGKCIGNLNL